MSTHALFIVANKIINISDEKTDCGHTRSLTEGSMVVKRKVRSVSSSSMLQSQTLTPSFPTKKVTCNVMNFYDEIHRSEFQEFFPE